MGATPVSSPLLIPPTARKATHFHGPVVSGSVSSLGGPNYVRGQAQLALRFDVNGAGGSFGLTAPAAVNIYFPPGTILLWMTATVTTAFNGTTPAISLGKTAGGTEYATLSLAALGSGMNPTPPLLIGTVTDATGKVFLSVSGAPTQGYALVSIMYLGTAAAAGN